MSKLYNLNPSLILELANIAESIAKGMATPATKGFLKRLFNREKEADTSFSFGLGAFNNALDDAREEEAAFTAKHTDEQYVPEVIEQPIGSESLNFLTSLASNMNMPNQIKAVDIHYEEGDLDFAAHDINDEFSPYGVSTDAGFIPGDVHSAARLYKEMEISEAITAFNRSNLMGAMLGVATAMTTFSDELQAKIFSRGFQIPERKGNIISLRRLHSEMRKSKESAFNTAS